jgi:hypothetical protein
MTAFRPLVALSMAALVSACASPGGVPATAPSPSTADQHAAHHPNASASAPMAAMEPRMKAMQEMHQKMMNAKTPGERQALMADHMKAMKGGMGMMKEMSGTPGMVGMGGKAPVSAMGATSGMAEGKGMPGDMAERHQMMAQRMDMMQMMMEMMMDRMPPAPAKK